MIAHIFNPSTQETGARILTGIQRQLGIHSEEQAIQHNVAIPFFQTEVKNKIEKVEKYNT